MYWAGLAALAAPLAYASVAQPGQRPQQCY